MCGPLGIFNSYVSLIQIKIFFGTVRRISSPTNLAVTSWNISCLLSPGLYGSQPLCHFFSRANFRARNLTRVYVRLILNFPTYHGIVSFPIFFDENQIF